MVNKAGIVCNEYELYEPFHVWYGLPINEPFYDEDDDVEYDDELVVVPLPVTAKGYTVRIR